MQTYLLSAAGVIFLTVIVSLLVPEGKLNKTITFVMRLVCIFVLVQPVTKLFGFDYGGGAQATFDYEYICGQYSRGQSEQLSALIEKKFSVKAKAEVDVTYSENGFEVGEARVELPQECFDLIDEISAYLKELGYINISVYAKSD